MGDIPDWITDEFLEKALNSRTTDKYEVVSSELSRATAPGENFASDIYRAAIKVRRNEELESMSVIIKAELNAKEEMSKFVAEGNSFQREIDAFTVALPVLDQLLEKLPTKCQPYTAKCYYTHIGPPPSLLVMEDLKDKGFRLIEKGIELDLDHCFLTVRRLATYQAASVVLSKTDPTKLDPFRVGMFSERMRETFEKIIKPVITNVIKEAGKWPESKDCVPGLRDLSLTFYDDILQCVQRDDNAFNVLVHEDIWLNNMMFKYTEDNKKVIDVRLVDLQLYHWTTPAVDLLYFICANATTELVDNHHIVVDEYYKTLKETLTALGYPHLCPPRSHLYEEMDKRCKFGVIMGLLARSVIFMNRDKAPDFENIIANDGEINLSPTFFESIRKILPMFQEKGWI